MVKLYFIIMCTTNVEACTTMYKTNIKNLPTTREYEYFLPEFGTCLLYLANAT